MAAVGCVRNAIKSGLIPSIGEFESIDAEEDLR